MNIFTAHTKAAAPVKLVPEGFAWGGFVFGPFWLFWQRAWIFGAFVLLTEVLIGRFAPPLAGRALGFGVSLLVGLLGHDMRRWSLDRGGYQLAEIVAARDEDAALARLLAARPELLKSLVT